MSRERLQGGCSCGRNRYIIQIPSDATEKPQVFFDSSHSHRRSQATPLSAWLRVPLSWYQSSTIAFFDDETNVSIRRAYTSPHEQSSKRHFCGFCGTPLSYWSESPPSEAEYISLTLGSLSGHDLRDLEDLGILPQEAVEDAALDNEKIEARGGNDANEGLPWFESLVKGSQLGNMRRSWGSRESGNGRFKVEWEIVEWTEENESDPTPPSKRKIGEVEEHDSHMEGGH
ncbi:hypothetical protein V8E51_004939 [Hyaloscypha variabilis]